jgi:hypothetical protein
MRILFSFFFFFLFSSALFGQNGRLYFIVDKDTLKKKYSEVNLFLETNCGDLVPFNFNDSLIYPTKISSDSLNSIVVKYKDKTLSFFNLKDQVKNSHLPLEVIKVTQPWYSTLFTDKRNLYFTVDNYPFETNDRKESAKMNLDYAKVPLNKIIVVELYYQVSQMSILNDKGK